MTLAYLTDQLPGVGGTIKQTPEDFRVTELPLYEPCGEGTHVYFGLRKRGLATRDAIARVARALDRRPDEFGYAGLKDARAVTEQAVSIEHLGETQQARLKEFSDDAVSITWLSRHGNKLKPGHLAGNRFDIRIRGPRRAMLDRAEAIVEVLRERGVPNYFGEQRFGQRGDNARLGTAAVSGRLDEFARIFLREPRAADPPQIRRARELFEAGCYAEALDQWPRRCRNERNALAAWIRSEGQPNAAFAAVDKFLKRFAVSALQGHLFNCIVDRRINEIDTVQAGDLAKKTDSGGVFLVEDATADKVRAARFEISPTAPLFGYRVDLAEGKPGQVEREVLSAAGLPPEAWRRAGAHKVKGTRRALRFRVRDAEIEPGADASGRFLRLCFSAPPGCYATAVLREIMKVETAAAVEEVT